MATTPTKTLITVGEIKVGDLIETRHETRAYNLETGRSRPVVDVYRWYVIEIGKWTTRLEDFGNGKELHRFRSVKLQSESNRRRVEAGGKPVYRHHNWSDGYSEFSYLRID